jgi:transposase, IS5 family
MTRLVRIGRPEPPLEKPLCERWVENPYFQLFCGEEFFQHKTPFDRSSLTRWRQRMGEEKLTALIQASLATATRTGAAKPSDFSRVIVDTTVQPKAVAFPTDAKLMRRARERLVRLAKKTGVSLRQSYERVGKLALIAHQRYAHAKQFQRANRALRSIRTYLGRVCRDLVRKTGDDAQLRAIFAQPLSLAFAVREQRRISAGGRSIRCTLPRSNASARARRTALTSSASRCRSPRPCSARKADSSSPM